MFGDDAVVVGGFWVFLLWRFRYVPHVVPKQHVNKVSSRLGNARYPLHHVLVWVSEVFVPDAIIAPAFAVAATEILGAGAGLIWRPKQSDTVGTAVSV